MTADPTVDALEAIAAALTELTSAPASADMADALQSIAAALTELVSGRTERKPTDLTPLVDAVKAIELKPQFDAQIHLPTQPIDLNVTAGPQTHNVTVESPGLEGMCVDFTYDNDDRIRRAKFVRDDS